MRHWKDPGMDGVLMAQNIVLFIISWGLLGWAVVRNIRDARRAKNLSAQIVTIKDELKLSTDTVLDLRNKLKAMPEALRQEAQDKAIETWTMVSERERRENIYLKSKISTLENQIEQLQLDPSTRIGNTINDGITLTRIQNAPHLLIDYSTEGDKNFLTMTNDGPGTLLQWNLRPLQLRYEKNLWSVYGNLQITNKNKIVQEVSFDGSGSMSLVEFLRTKLPVIGTKVTAEVYYEDSNGSGFVREFTLKPYQNNALIWEPGTITPQ
jgi:hypothetical protein